MTNRKPDSDKRFFFVSLAIFVLVSIFALYVVLSRNANTSTAQSTPFATANFSINATVTQVAAPVPVTGELADQLTKVSQLVAACPDYDEDRRTQMNLHIAWLRAPDTIPQFMQVPLGSNPTGRLIEGMATYTVGAWGLHGKAADSCLLPIGRQLNLMLIAAGQPTFPDFE
jgi:hypothetical protein